jgi:pimeloyl-ACP methyl ester carboxylesterase
VADGIAHLESGIDIWFDTIGEPSNETILLGHPGSTDALWWPDEFCQLLADGGLFVVRYDSRDAGQSSHLDQYGTDWATLLAGPPYTWEDMASDVVGLLNHLGIERGHLAGYSAGSVISNYVALDHPERVASLTMMGTWFTTHGQDNVESRRKAVDLLAFDFFTDPPDAREDKIETLIRICKATCGSAYPFEAERVARWAETAVDRGLDFRAVRRTYMANINSSNRAARLAGMKVPTLVIQGQQDSFGNVSEAILLAATVANGQFLLMTGMGHDLPTAAFPTISRAIIRHTKGMRIHT